MELQLNSLALPSGDVSVKFRFEKSEYPDFKPLAVKQ